MSEKNQSKLLLGELSGVLTEELSHNIALFAINKDTHNELQGLLEEVLRESEYLDKKKGYLVIKENMNRVSLELYNVTKKISDNDFKKLIQGNEYIIPNRNTDFFTIFFSGNNLYDRKKSMVSSLAEFINLKLNGEPERMDKFDVVFEQFLQKVNINDYDFLENVIIKTEYSNHHIEDIFADADSWDFDDNDI